MSTVLAILLLLAIPLGLAVVIVLCFAPSFQSFSSGIAGVETLRRAIVSIGRFFGRGGESAMARVQRQVFAATIARLPRSRAGVVYLPQRVVVTVSAVDFAHIASFQHVVERELVEELRRYASRFGMTGSVTLSAKVERDAALAEGQVRIDMSQPTEYDGARTEPLPSELMPSPQWSLAFPRRPVVRVGASPVVVGRRSPGCTVVLEDLKVSGVHCEFVTEGGDLHVRDLESLNGVKVNGRKVLVAQLAEGDKVVIGATTVRVSRS